MPRQTRSNGVGPAWAPAPVRAALTRLAALFFEEASWERHDRGYGRGGSEADRARFDRLFLAAMLRDASLLKTVPRMFGASLLAWIFWTAVRMGGWTAFNYRRER